MARVAEKAAAGAEAPTGWGVRWAKAPTATPMARQIQKPSILIVFTACLAIESSAQGASAWRRSEGQKKKGDPVARIALSSSESRRPCSLW
jgi:hypothetical protein